VGGWVVRKGDHPKIKLQITLDGWKRERIRIRCFVSGRQSPEADLLERAKLSKQGIYCGSD